MFEMLATFYSPLERPPRVDWDLCVRASFYEPSFGPFPTLALHRYTNDRLSAYRPRVRRCYRFLPKASAPSAQSLARALARLLFTGRFPPIPASPRCGFTGGQVVAPSSTRSLFSVAVSEVGVVRPASRPTNHRRLIHRRCSIIAAIPVRKIVIGDNFAITLLNGRLRLSRHCLIVERSRGANEISIRCT